jgi:ribose 1,5-bisphosphokinase
LARRPPRRVTGLSERIGPGRLILVVGPSGAGKDTLIDLARKALAEDASVVFPRRVVTRPASAFEDHDTLSEADFSHALRVGAFALSWEAHGLRYGVPAGVDGEISAGRTVVCNVSRTIIGAARVRYSLVTVVLITAPADVLAERLAARARSSDGEIARRLARAPIVDGRDVADVVIENVESPASSAQKLVALIRGTHNFVPRTSEP